MFYPEGTEEDHAAVIQSSMQCSGGGQGGSHREWTRSQGMLVAGLERKEGIGRNRSKEQAIEEGLKENVAFRMP